MKAATMLALDHAGAPLSDLLRRINRDLREAGVPVASTHFMEPLERMALGGDDEVRIAGSIPIRRLEGDTITARSLGTQSAHSPIRYFLDGVQWTKTLFHVRHVPVSLTISLAAILERNDRGEASLLPDSLRIVRSWIMPAEALTGEFETVYSILRKYDQVPRDPLRGFSGTEEYVQQFGDLGRLQKHTLKVAGDARAEMERDLLAWWQRNRDDSGWIVVDGGLHHDVDRAVGLVKNFTYQHLTGPEAWNLFALAEGQRTSAFAEIHNNAKTLWYLRMRDARGRDPRYGLIRPETRGQITDPSELDQFSSWLLSERAPRATNDSRSDVLLYPIHLLEMMLKRRLAREILGLPGAR